jgi:hypothetical protein
MSLWLILKERIADFCGQGATQTPTSLCDKCDGKGAVFYTEETPNKRLKRSLEQAEAERATWPNSMKDAIDSGFRPAPVKKND